MSQKSKPDGEQHLTFSPKIFIKKPLILYILCRYLLGKDGFEHLDPFIPVEVPGYSEKELQSCLDYFRERRWIQRPQELDNELAFLSASNPFKLMNICAPL